MTDPTSRQGERVRLIGAAGGIVFAILVVIAFAIAPGPGSARGDDVVAYYSKHGTAVAWQAAIVGIALVFFIWFSETFATGTAAGSLTVVAAAVTAALYLVAVGCWEVLGETFNGGNLLEVPSESLGDAHFLYAAGLGAVHMAHFTTAAYVGSTAVAILASGAPWRWLGWVGIVLTPICLLEAVIGLASQSGWSDVLDTVVFLAFVAWVLATSVWLVHALQRRGLTVLDETTRTA